MNGPDRNNPYSFQEYLDWRNNVDYYADDTFFQEVLRCYTGAEFDTLDREAREVSKKASRKWREIADEIAQPEKRPWMQHYDGHGNRIDRIVRPAELLEMEREVFSEGIFSETASPWTRLVKMYLIYQNGEACIACPLVCTEGLVEIVSRYPDSPELKHILRHCREGIDGDFAIGAQYLSEIQGGSDVGANLLEAVEDEEGWRLYGTKFFCSATHADYACVTAKPAGSDKVALFVVPSWLPGDREKEKRNGYTIDRIKWKMGTSELTTAELTFNGTVAYPVGPLERGLANVVGIVLTYSRLTVGLSAAASMTRAAREVKKYAGFREAFGMPIGNFPLLAGQIEEIDRAAKRTTAGAFRLYREFIDMGGRLRGGLKSDEPLDERKKNFRFRELVMLQKITGAWDSTETLHNAMSVLGGHGVMEDFSSLPRLYRDSAVNELWEGPRNVLLTQIHRDMQRVAEWYPPGELVADILEGVDEEKVETFSREAEELIGHPNLFQMDEATLDVCRRWDRFCHELFHAYQEQALARVLSGDRVVAG